jgi:hypothetical protein
MTQEPPPPTCSSCKNFHPCQCVPGGREHMRCHDEYVGPETRACKRYEKTLKGTGR